MFPGNRMGSAFCATRLYFAPIAPVKMIDFNGARAALSKLSISSTDSGHLPMPRVQGPANVFGRPRAAFHQEPPVRPPFGQRAGSAARAGGPQHVSVGREGLNHEATLRWSALDNLHGE